jgi:nucleoside-diphosphate-sugar epimerase
MACDAPGVSGEVINVAAGGRVSLNRLFETMKGIIGAQVEPDYVAPRAGDVRDSQADITKARRLLAFEPRVSLEEGLRRTVDWYRASRASPATASSAASSP